LKHNPDLPIKYICEPEEKAVTTIQAILEHYHAKTFIDWATFTIYSDKMLGDLDKKLAFAPNHCGMVCLKEILGTNQQ